MKSLAIKLLILFGATGLLPWVAFFVGQVGSKAALWAHVTGVVVVLALKGWDLLKSKKSKRSQELDGDSPKR